ncbi:glycosyltransferase family 2 protein [Flavobacterium humi]|uniref:Glycosyltransferase family 2 protein n=1 Tax=Flavobacterium humi TaxID=2562683 RepID=A0A4Z0L8P9_9FLAO|nr:glycosyltransferase family 2 protein [Flavobacterium humi]TGD58164.1 glycosyltransferase family 2 protein [Flavobacterium humi]
MLSILIPTYNYSALPLVSILWEQAMENGVPFEIIVLDDGSSDTSLWEENAKINTLPNCRFERNEANLGRAETRNKLAQVSRYDWCLFLDSDVIPVTKDYVKTYIDFIGKEYDAIIGGIRYEDKTADSSKILRYKYGKSREENKADLRKQNPYSFIFSGNILIRKAVFVAHNYSSLGNFYGLDIYFAYQLYMDNVPVLHIDNEIYHLGLEDNEVFFRKSLDSLDSRIKLLGNKPNIDEINSLLKHYNILRKRKLDRLIASLFRLSEPVLKKLILNRNPNLLSFDLYRLGYICTIKPI